ncbi:MAG: type II secretion system protein, partial [Eubacterium sp.]
MQFINKLKKNQKGFTLVELIVVLVILAILAAFTIPTMLGFVNDAKSKALIAQTRLIYLAASAGVTEYAGSADNAAKGALVDGIYTAADATAVATVTASKTVTGSNS